MLVGNASATSDLPIGQIILNPIKFNVSSGLTGLQGLQGDTVINTVDVMGGTTDHIELDIDCELFFSVSSGRRGGNLQVEMQ